MLLETLIDLLTPKYFNSLIYLIQTKHDSDLYTMDLIMTSFLLAFINLLILICHY
jgi:hypothetical protein